MIESTMAKTKFPKIENNKERIPVSSINTDEVNLYSKLIIGNSTTAPILVVLHGLLANGSNFLDLANNLVDYFSRIFLIDLRNHGCSDHHPSMTYNELATDVKRHLNKLELSQVILLGHSMGAKTAMTFATLYPEMLTGVIVLDTFPRDYADTPEIYMRVKELVDKLNEIDIDKYKGKKEELLSQLTEHFGSTLVNLIEQNLTEDKEGNYIWKCDIVAIKDNFPNIIGFDRGDKVFTGSAIVLLGEQSHCPFDKELYKEVFPFIDLHHDIKYIPHSKHWIHLDNPHDLYKAIGDYMKNRL